MFIGSTASFWLFIYSLLYIYPLMNGLLSFGNETRLAADLLAYCFLPLAIFVALRIFKKGVFGELVGELRTSVQGVLMSIMIGFVLAYALYVPIDTTYRNFPSLAPKSENALLPLISEHGLKFVIYLSITAGVVEEFLYKAVLYRVTAGSRFESPAYFAILSAALFGIAHQEQGIVAVLVYTFLYGLPSALYYLKTRNIANLIVAHMVGDFFIFGWVWANL